MKALLQLVVGEQPVERLMWDSIAKGKHRDCERKMLDDTARNNVGSSCIESSIVYDRDLLFDSNILGCNSLPCVEKSRDYRNNLLGIFERILCK